MSLLKPISLGFVIATCLLMILTFFDAYFSPTKSTLVTINSVREANFEMFIMIPLLIFSMLYLVWEDCKK